MLPNEPNLSESTQLLTNNGLESPKSNLSADCNKVEPEQQVGSGSEVLNGVEPNSNAAENQTTVEDEDEDEDVREAKASVKGYLDQVKETEKFLKSLQAAEDDLEKKRREMFVLDVLLLNAKLNGQGTNGVNDYNSPPINSMDQPAPFARAGSMQPTHRSIPHTAPIGSSNRIDFNSDLKAGYSFGNPYSSAGAYNSQLHHNEFLADTWAPSRSGLSFGSVFTPSYQPKVNVDPLEPVQPLYSPHISDNTAPIFRSKSPMSVYGRSQSQLGDDFDYRRATRRRPLSINVDSEMSHFSSNHNRVEDSRIPSSAPLRSRRSLSQVRYQNDSSYSNNPMMSEYRSSFGPNLRNNRATSVAPERHYSSTLYASEPDVDYKYSSSSYATVQDASDSDDGLQSYRPHSYVPRVIPSFDSKPSRISRRSYVPSKPRSSARISAENSPQRDTPLRRTSLQPISSSAYADKASTDDRLTEDENSPIRSNRRRLSLTSANELSATQGASLPENSRLSELEQRIQANKKRREELLLEARGVSSRKHTSGAGSKLAREDTGTTTSQRHTTKQTEELIEDTTDDELMDSFERPPQAMASARQTTRRCSHRESSSTNGSDEVETEVLSGKERRFSRPSRLESMEARIKRKSYCLRVNSPELARSNH